MDQATRDLLTRTAPSQRANGERKLAQNVFMQLTWGLLGAAALALATTGAQRSPLLADVPTVQEAGYPALEVDEWFGVFVPADTPAETVSRLNGAIRAVVNTGAFKNALAKLAVDPVGETPKEFAQLVKSDFDRWGPIVQVSGFTPED